MFNKALGSLVFSLCLVGCGSSSSNNNSPTCTPAPAGGAKAAIPAPPPVAGGTTAPAAGGNTLPVCKPGETGNGDAGNGGNGPVNPVGTATVGADVIGNWKSDCTQIDGGRSVMRYYSFEAGRLSEQNELSADANCQQVVMKFVELGSINANQNGNLTIKWNTIYVTAYDENVVQQLNNLKVCKATGFAINADKQIPAASCEGDKLFGAFAKPTTMTVTSANGVLSVQSSTDAENGGAAPTYQFQRFQP